MLVNAENLKIVRMSESKNLGVYSFEPLPQGFGATLGNSIRRVLLTSIKGAAVTQVKIAGAAHQFTTIEGVKEDSVELLLNLKKLRFRIYSSNPVVVTIQKKGKGAVTGADIVTTSDIELMNKDTHIATLADSKVEFKAELVVEPGVGYSPAEERKTAKLGVIALDAVFSPIISASYEVQPTRFGDRTDLDKVILTVETDGSLEPIDAITQSAAILEQYYSVISNSETTTKEKQDASVKETKIRKASPVENVAVEELPLQTRTINALKKHGIDTLHELSEKTDEDLADIKNLGEKSLNEIKKLLEKEKLR